ncbi:MAG: DUF1080 domain-containing protein [Verrucomicrobiota bacterium]|nr:DUF1080 domain-containing protein [Verrucomicrobiota bacterium]
MKKLILFTSVIVFFNAIAAGKGNAALDPAQAGPDFEIQGEYVGTHPEGDQIGLNIIALGDGKFRAVGFEGGLPGDGWTKGKEKHLFKVTNNDGKMVFLDGDAIKYTAEFKGGKLVSFLDGKPFSTFKKVIRKSPTIGSKPPKGAIVLFDGTGADNFKPGKMSEDKLLIQGANSVQRFQSHKLHIEFFLPFKPAARGQSRGNSGCYLQGRYEVQVLDSFGLEGRNNECGGIYSIKDPDLNMCYPPLSWQTYDVEFTAAKFKDGKKLEDARMTVFHNGVKIHDDVKLPKRTTASPLAEGPEPGFLHLQNHGNPVRYRNIWVLEMK